MCSQLQQDQDWEGGESLIVFPNLYATEEVRRLVITIAFNLCTVEKVGELVGIILITDHMDCGLWATMLSHIQSHAMLVSSNPLKIKLRHLEDESVSKHKAFLRLACWQKWFITSTGLGKDEGR
jgi:hypothetical protein